MLLIAKSMAELDFQALMEVYAQSNQENGEDFYPYETPQRQIFMAEQAFYQYLLHDFFTQAGAVYTVWQEGERYVSALRLEPYRDGLLLEALETAPNDRRRGFATDLIQSVTALSDQKIYSHVSKRNTASLRTHEKCGFRRILEYAAFVDGSVAQNSCTMCWMRESL